MCRRGPPTHLAYVLTLGVLDPYRKAGVGRDLIDHVVRQATSLVTCRAVYLHVIANNYSAINFYARLQFECVRRMHQFYFIPTDRKPTPGQVYYDAFLLVHYVNNGRAPFSCLRALVCVAKSVDSSLKRLVRWFSLRKLNQRTSSGGDSTIRLLSRRA
mmetsp:Transcript_16619/g.28027  ORF Transcript_16619/g.28027 Transcript_16619/m.28027 type:complete len:158 (-) Transcript_16619:187-660(-)